MLSTHDMAAHLHDHVEQALPILHVAGAHQRKGDSWVEVRSRDVGKGVDCVHSTGEMCVLSCVHQVERACGMLQC